MPDNPYNLNHSIIQDTDGRYEVKLYCRGHLCGGASNFKCGEEAIDAAYDWYLKQNPVRKYS